MICYRGWGGCSGWRAGSNGALGRRAHTCLALPGPNTFRSPSPPAGKAQVQGRRPAGVCRRQQRHWARQAGRSGGQGLLGRADLLVDGGAGGRGGDRRGGGRAGAGVGRRGARAARGRRWRKRSLAGARAQRRIRRIPLTPPPPPRPPRTTHVGQLSIACTAAASSAAPGAGWDPTTDWPWPVTKTDGARRLRGMGGG